HVDEDGIEVADRRLAHGGEHARVDFRRSRAHQRALGRVEGIDAFDWREIVHGVTPGKRSKKAFAVRPGLQAERLPGVGFVEHFDGADLPAAERLHFHRPARRHVAGLDPVVHDRAVEAQAARDFCLAAEEFYESFRAVHARKINTTYLF